MSRNEANESYKMGSLPGSMAPLAMSYVPMQTAAAPNYEAGDAPARGTLFPGLDLPFMNLVNSDVPKTPLAELMAIDFVADELELYLNTHADDRDAFELYQVFLAMQKEAHERYAARYGPICQKDMLGTDAYAWLRDPWPWELPGRRES